MAAEKIDLEAPLGDGSEVTAPAVEGGFSWRLESPHFFTTEESRPVATVQIDEIANRKVWLWANTEEDNLELSTLLQLPPASARQLGRMLIRAAAYAEEQGGDADGDA